MDTHESARWSLDQWARHIGAGGCPSCRDSGTLARRTAQIEAWAMLLGTGEACRTCGFAHGEADCPRWPAREAQP